MIARSGSGPKPASAPASGRCSVSVSEAAGAAAPMQASHQRAGGAESARQHGGALQTYLG